MHIFNQNEFQECVRRFSVANNPPEVADAWLQLKGNFPELSGVVHLDSYDKTVMSSCVRKYTNKPYDFLVPYFMSESLYFIDDDMLTSILKNGKKHFPIDYTVMFDTNIASYINKLINGKSIGNVQEDFLRLIDELLRDELNFDFIFYLIENIKNVLPTASVNAKTSFKFWLSLNKSFRENLVSLHLFSSINTKEYKRTLNPKYEINYRQAVMNAIDSSYSFYASKNGRTALDGVYLLQRILLLNLIGMIRIQEESNKNAKNKMTQYLNFMHNTIGLYMDREAVIAHKYFLSRDNLPILNKIRKNCKISKLLKKLDNIAWDMIAPRMMEKLISSGLGGDGAYFIPMFLTFDKNLKNMLQLYPIKGAIYNRDTGEIVSFPNINTGDYFKDHNLGKEIELICSEESRFDRNARARHTRETIHKAIFSEYRKLINVIKS